MTLGRVSVKRSFLVSCSGMVVSVPAICAALFVVIDIACFSIVCHRGHAALLFKDFEKVVVAAESAQLADIANRHSLKKILFAHVNARPCDICVQSDPGALFEFSGNVLAGDEKFFFQRL